MSLFDPTHLIQALGILGAFAVVFAETGLFFGFFLPGDSLLFAIGVLGAQGYLSVALYIAVVAGAAILGDTVGYLAGYRYGPRVFKKKNSFFFDETYVVRSEQFYKKYGKLTLVLARYTPIVRTFAPILAGVGKMEYKSFLKWNIFGAVLWSTTVIGAGYFIGKKVVGIDAYLVPGIIIVVALSSLPVLYEAVKRVFSQRRKMK
jgi:membrane-associated protein